MDNRQQKRARERQLKKEAQGKASGGQSQAASDAVSPISRGLHYETLRVIRGYLNSIEPGRIVKRLIRAGCEVFAVPSERFQDVIYSVFVDADGSWACTCDDFKSHVRERMCKHIIEVLYRFFPSIAPTPPTDDEMATFSGQYRNARRFPHTPYTYDGGPAESTRNDHALQKEDDRLEELVVDLGKLINKRWPLEKVRNRPTLPWGDRVVVRVLRLQHRKSIRKFFSIGKRLERELKIKFAPSRGSQSKYYAKQETLEKLRQAFVFTTGVFVEMDDDVIIDSSGVSPFFVSCWLQSDHGTKNFRSGTQWFKVHVAIGRRSMAILGFIVTLNTGSESSDGRNFGPLLSQLYAHGFRPRHVIADNIYITDENIASAREIGTTLVGPLKSRNFRRDGTPSPKIAPVARFSKEYPEAYDLLCRARSVVEAVFSAEVRFYRNITSIGTQKERNDAKHSEGDILFVSRRCEFWARAIRYNLGRTVNVEHRWGELMSYRLRTVFSYSPRRFSQDEIYGKGA